MTFAKSGSACWISWLKQVITPMIFLPLRIGKPKAPCSSASAAISERIKLRSLTTSAIQTGSRLAQTRPGSPIPDANVVCRLRMSNSCISKEILYHEFSKDSRFACRSSIQNSLKSHPKLSQIPCKIWGMPSLIVVDSAKTRVVTYSAFRCCSVRWRKRSSSKTSLMSIPVATMYST